MSKVEIEYTNYRGERRRRTIVPTEIVFGCNQWHTEPQWLLRALDVRKMEMRDFAMKDIHDWTPAREDNE